LIRLLFSVVNLGLKALFRLKRQINFDMAECEGSVGFLVELDNKRGGDFHCEFHVLFMCRVHCEFHFLFMCRGVVECMHCESKSLSFGLNNLDREERRTVLCFLLN
jgi:hypothetical protein